jgi:hypothetical protein
MITSQRNKGSVLNPQDCSKKLETANPLTFH